MRTLLTMMLLLTSCLATGAEGDVAKARQDMVDRTIRARGVKDASVLKAMAAVPRHEFVPEAYRKQAYADSSLPIGHGQTISQPYVVALMTELARLKPGEKVLEIGTGSGYQAAVLAAVGAQVYSIEILEPLARTAAQRLDRLGYKVTVKAGDGYKGWPEHAPFDAILLTAAPDEVPPPLLEQLAEGGRLVLPEGEGVQTLRVYLRQGDEFKTEDHGLVRFVPMTGEAQERR